MISRSKSSYFYLELLKISYLFHFMLTFSKLLWSKFLYNVFETCLLKIVQKYFYLTIKSNVVCKITLNKLKNAISNGTEKHNPKVFFFLF